MRTFLTEFFLAAVGILMTAAAVIVILVALLAVLEIFLGGK